MLGPIPATRTPPIFCFIHLGYNVRFVELDIEEILAMVVVSLLAFSNLPSLSCRIYNANSDIRTPITGGFGGMQNTSVCNPSFWV